MAKRKLNIGITCYPTFGGSGVVATEIGMAMAKRGHKVHFICYDVPRRLNRFTENVYFHEVEVHESPLFIYPPYSLALASRMVEVSNNQKLDLLHVHYAVPHATSAYLAKQIMGSSAPKVVTTLHGTDITLVGNERNYLPITRFSIIMSDGVTAPSQFLRHATYDKLSVPSAVPIEVIPNFVDTDLYTPLPEDKKASFRHFIGECPKEGRVITHVSNFRPVKRIEDVIRVFALVREKIDVHLAMVGDGPERSKAEDLVKELGIVEHVCFLGKQESPMDIVQNSDLFLLPSKNESFGLAALEALSCGVPVIASRAEGIPELVKHGEVGYLSDVGDVEDMAKNAIRLLSDPVLYQTMSTAARAHVLANYRLEVLIPKYEEYYYKILDRK